MNSKEKANLDLPTEMLPSLGCISGSTLHSDLPARSDVLLRQISPAALAYLGDAVYELHVRMQYLLPPKRVQLYHDQVVAAVRAEAQANYLSSLQPNLSEQELDIVKRGRNAAARGPKRLNPEIYQQATSLETLLGYLYLTDPQRLAEVLQQISFKSEGATVG